MLNGVVLVSSINQYAKPASLCALRPCWCPTADSSCMMTACVASIGFIPDGTSATSTGQKCSVLSPQS